MIDCNGILILHTTRSIIEMLYDNIVAILDIRQIELPKNIENLVQELYVATGGFSMDIAKYLKTFNEAIFFAELIKEAIVKGQTDFPDLPQITMDKLWDFHKAILEYAETLKTESISI